MSQKMRKRQRLEKMFGNDLPVRIAYHCGNAPARSISVILPIKNAIITLFSKQYMKIV